MALGLISQLDGIVLDLRCAAIASANSKFAQFILQFEEQLANSGWDLQRVVPILQQSLAAHQRADYLGLADSLQYELRLEMAP
jgi:hypothetical protein